MRNLGLRRWWMRALAVSVLALLNSLSSGIRGDEVREKDASEVYLVDYPKADRYCPPIRSYFYDVEQSIQKVGRRTIRHQLNGGYGLPVRKKVKGENLLHLGADIGWYQVGEPVFCIADGVVRVSTGTQATKQKKGRSPGTMFWGNLIVIEHHLMNDEHILSISLL